MTEHSLVIGGELHLLGPVGFRDFEGEGFTVRDVTEALTEMDGDITVRINSGGGIALDGIAIHSLLRQHDGKVTTVVQGIAASSASIIFMAGEERIMSFGAMLMIHDASGITMGTEADHIKTAAVLGKLSNSSASIYAGRTERDAKAERLVMRDETWFDSAEAVEAGYATAEIDTGEAEASAFNYELYMNAPDFLVKATPDRYESFGREAAALAAPPPRSARDDKMTKPTTDPQPAAPTPEPAPLTLATLKTNHPDIVDALIAETGTDSAKAERDRIRECLAVFGYDNASEATKALAFDGKSHKGDLSYAITEEARAKGTEYLADLARSEAELVKLKAAPVTVVPDTPTKATDAAGWTAEYEASDRDLKGSPKDVYLSAADYAAFKGAEARGQIKMLRNRTKG